jgi:hypothetical protein
MIDTSGLLIEGAINSGSYLFRNLRNRKQYSVDNTKLTLQYPKPSTKSSLVKGIKPRKI